MRSYKGTYRDYAIYTDDSIACIVFINPVFQVYLPSGVMVTIQRMFWGLSTYIKAPTPFDRKSKSKDHYSEGLCGNYNGDRVDDFAPGEEAKFAETYRYMVTT